MKKIILIAIAATLGAGCAAKPRACTPGVLTQGCTSMAETYQAALGGGGDRGSLFPGAEDLKDGKKGTPASPLNLQAGRHQLAGPVFNPPKPFRLGIAPWTDANGILHSGEYIYFTTPGRWSYGPMALPGSASGVLSPIRPDQLGFEVRNSVDPENDARERNGVLMPERNFGPQGLK